MSYAPDGRPLALVVVESMLGNTEAVAHVVAQALERVGYGVTLHEVGDPAMPTGRLDTDLVVVGAPTHAFSLSRPSARADAARHGASAAAVRTGLREWLSEVTPAHGRRVPLLAFDTRVQRARRLRGAAGPRACVLARHRGFAVHRRPGSFMVADNVGPLLGGELPRAEIWVTTAVADLAPRPGRQHEPVAAAR